MSAYKVADEPDMDDVPKTLDEYRSIYAKSIQDPTTFWAQKARKLLDWKQPFSTTHSGKFEDGDNAWFRDGLLSALYNCIDRHAAKDPDKVAVIYEGDEINTGRQITYGELLREVSRLSYVLKDIGVRKCDVVAIYLPNIPEAIFAMLVYSRIGAVHSVVFIGFSAASLRDRILNGNSKVLITVDESRRGGKTVHTKVIVNEALLECPLVAQCIVLKHTGSEVP